MKIIICSKSFLDLQYSVTAYTVTRSDLQLIILLCQGNVFLQYVKHYCVSYWHMSTQLTGRAVMCSHVSYLSSILFCKYSSVVWLRGSSEKSTSQNFPKLHWQLWQPKVSFQKGLSSARNKIQPRSVLSVDITFCQTLLTLLCWRLLISCEIKTKVCLCEFSALWLGKWDLAQQLENCSQFNIQEKAK